MTTPTTKVDDGGPLSNLTVRDWFAGRAMAAILGCHRRVNTAERATEDGWENADCDISVFDESLGIDGDGTGLAEDAYRCADGMMRVRADGPVPKDEDLYSRARHAIDRLRKVLSDNFGDDGPDSVRTAMLVACNVSRDLARRGGAQ